MFQKVARGSENTYTSGERLTDKGINHSVLNDDSDIENQFESEGLFDQSFDLNSSHNNSVHFYNYARFI